MNQPKQFKIKFTCATHIPKIFSAFFWERFFEIHDKFIKRFGLGILQKENKKIERQQSFFEGSFFSQFLDFGKIMWPIRVFHIPISFKIWDLFQHILVQNISSDSQTYVVSRNSAKAFVVDMISGQNKNNFRLVNMT